MDHFKETLNKLIGSRIKVFREEINLSQLELSEKLQISRSSISNIEVGRHQASLIILFQISKELGINIKELIPTFEELTTLSTSNYQDYSKYLNTPELNKNEKDKIEQYILNI